MYEQEASVGEYVPGVRRVKIVCASSRSLLSSFVFDRRWLAVTLEFKNKSKILKVVSKNQLVKVWGRKQSSQIFRYEKPK